MDRPSVAIVGATGAAGGTLVRVLGERAFPAAELRLFASPRSAGAHVTTHLGDAEVEAVSDDALGGIDVVFFAAGAATSLRLAPRVAASGGVAVDKSSAYRMDPAVPLVVPEVNPGSLARHRGIVANPNCVAIPLSIVLAPLRHAYGLRHVTVATYQAASGAGRGLAEELETQARDSVAGATPVAHVYPHVLHANVVPGGRGPLLRAQLIGQVAAPTAGRLVGADGQPAQAEGAMERRRDHRQRHGDAVGVGDDPAVRRQGRSVDLGDHQGHGRVHAVGRRLVDGHPPAGGDGGGQGAGRRPAGGEEADVDTGDGVRSRLGDGVGPPREGHRPSHAPR